MSQGKVHYFNKLLQEVIDRYKDRPHVYRAINEGTWSVCNINASGRITNDVNDVTCKRCLQLIDERKEFGL